MSWVDRISRVPSALACCRMPSISRVARPSRDAVGSSRKTSAGLVIRARAMASFCCSPPDKTDARCVSKSDSPTRCAQTPAAARASARLVPRKRNG
mmetsp:Transcript_28968/g.55506  ORF Transcript_28968/g.55506 Transcript_28968/m.55506 type:complete len:96 (-) Transcript_28968:998-1285(-)